MTVVENALRSSREWFQAELLRCDIDLPDGSIAGLLKRRDLCDQALKELGSVDVPRCDITHNPFGTDTWMSGYTCPCNVCREQIKLTKAG